jgi:hypothetical protein
MAQQIEQIADLLSRAGAAHHTFEQNELGGVYDADWPAWYADWVLQNGLNDLLGNDLDVNTLGPLLAEINNTHQQADTDLSWAQFTAQVLAETYKG